MSKSALGKADSSTASTDKKYRDAEWLREKYVDEGLSGYEIAEICDCGDSTVYSWLDRHDIERRDKSEACISTDGEHTDRAWFYEHYVEKDMSVHDIADVCGISSWTANHWRKRHNIEIHVTHAAGKEHPRYNSKQVNCSWCDKEIIRQKSQTEKHDRFYCSKECESKHKQEWQSGENHPHWRGGLVDLTCKECGEEYQKHPKSAQKSTFCSIECKASWMKKRPPEEHPGWKGGCGNWTYYGSNWPTQRKNALERDRRECVVCGETDSLHVHHITPLREFNDTEKANQLENLITLCPSCHGRWEGIYLRPDTR